MTAFHVLTGLHAGASLSLAPGRYRVVGDAEPHDADQASRLARITLFDWSSKPLDLQVDDQGMVTTCVQEGTAEPVFSDVWPIRQTRRFGTISLCLHPDGAGVATEVSYRLSPARRRRSNASTDEAIVPVSSTAGASSSWGTRACFVGAGLLVAVSALYGHTGALSPEPAGQAGFDCEWLARNLASRGLDELRVQKENDVIVLSGLVRNAAQGQSARMAAAEFLRGSHGLIVARWEVAEDIASTIETALRHSGLHAVYQGQGRFRVEGLVANPETYRLAAEPLRKDLGPNVKSLDFALHAAKRQLAVSAAMVADGLQYSERSDGAKVFSRSANGI